MKKKKSLAQFQEYSQQWKTGFEQLSWGQCFLLRALKDRSVHLQKLRSQVLSSPCELDKISAQLLETSRGPSRGLASAPRLQVPACRAPDLARPFRSRHHLLSMRGCGARNGNGMLAAWGRVRGLGVRGEAGAAAWTTRVVPRQTLRAAGERACLPHRRHRAWWSRPDSASDALRTRSLSPEPRPSCRPALAWASLPSLTHQPHRSSPPSSAPEGIPAQSAITLAFGRSHRASLAWLPCSDFRCFCSSTVRAPRNSATAHFSDLSVVCSPNRACPCSLSSPCPR